MRRPAHARLDRRSRPRQVACVLIEPVQGEGGYTPAPPAFLRGLRDVLRRARHPAHRRRGPVRLRADRQDVGVRARRDRAGRRRAWPRRSPTACRSRRSCQSRELQERWGRGAHGSTYGGNPVACAAGLAVLETIRERGPAGERRRARGGAAGRARRIAAEDDRIGDVRGPGLMIGVEFVRDRATREPDGDPARPADRRPARTPGLLVLTCGRQHEVVRWIPPLDVTRGRDQRGGRDLRGDPRGHPARLSAAERGPCAGQQRAPGGGTGRSEKRRERVGRGPSRSRRAACG